MATRATRTFGSNKANSGAELIAMRAEFNKLVDEVEELKAAYKVHTHSAVATKGPDGSAGTGFTPAFTTVDAQKVT
jgi:hypothetical protein